MVLVEYHLTLLTHKGNYVIMRMIQGAYYVEETREESEENKKCTKTFFSVHYRF